MKYTTLAILFALVSLTSCVDEDFWTSEADDSEIPEGIRNGYSLNLTVTLDNMGGGAATRGAYNSSIDHLLKEKENYIDPEKFRVIFFDNDDKLLFESKSRWVKQLETGSDHTEWLVSVPVFTYGNDIYEVDEVDENGATTGEKIKLEWDWDRIKEALTTNSFKVAILVNRPELDRYPELSDNLLPQHDYDNRGPYWNPSHTGNVDIFDLHHCQYDPLYKGKSMKYGYYNFIMGNWDGDWTSDFEDNDFQPTLSATSSWVYQKDEKKDKHGWNITTFRHPSHDYPIPMYGVQKFNKIENWAEGTPFNLSKITQEQENETGYQYKQVSLLRSVVRLELLIPKEVDGVSITQPEFVYMAFPNVYARCEPMDVWTPTNEIWEGTDGNHDNHCELEAIMHYGPISQATENSGDDKTDSNKEPIVRTGPEQYQEKLSWFYGVWNEKKWPFNGFTGTFASETPTTPYPRVFNPCIQRNSQVGCDEEGDMSAYDNDYYHYVVYTGERNVNDPSTLYYTTRTRKGDPTVVYWVFNIDKKVYTLPITNYENTNNPALWIPPITDYDFETKPLPSVPAADGNNGVPNGIVGYENIIQGYRPPNNDMPEPTAETLPWPLIRNHVYQLILTPQPDGAIHSTQTWSFKDEGFSTTTTNNLNADSKWINPGGTEPKVLSYENFGNDNQKGSATVNWGEGFEETTLTRTSENKFNSGDKIKIDGTEYTTIKTGKGDNGINDRTTTLTVPDTKVIKKLTLYSYINTSNTKLIDYPSGENNTEKIILHGNVTQTKANNYDVYQLNSGYLDDKIGNNIQLQVTDGFKEGDIITVAGFINKADKEATVALFTAENYNSTPSTIHTFEYFANFANSESITEQSYTLTKDYDVLYLGRSGGTAVNVTIISISRPADTQPCYWEEVGGKQYPENGATVMKAYQGQNTIDVNEFEIDGNPHQVTFTNNESGVQICYVALVEIANADGSPHYWELQKPNGRLTANYFPISELQDLEFQNDGSILIYDPDYEKKIRLTNTGTITFPKMGNGYTITIEGKSANSAATDRGIAPADGCDYLKYVGDEEALTNGQCIFLGSSVEGSKGTYRFKWEVQTDSEEPVEVKFKIAPKGGIDFYEFSVTPPDNDTRSTRATENNGIGLKVQSRDLYSKSIKFD